MTDLHAAGPRVLEAQQRELIEQIGVGGNLEPSVPE